MECRNNQTMTAVTEAMRHQLQPYLFQDRDVVRAHVHSFGCQLIVPTFHNSLSPFLYSIEKGHYTLL